jgi:hypothetical protein
MQRRWVRALVMLTTAVRHTVVGLQAEEMVEPKQGSTRRRQQPQLSPQITTRPSKRWHPPTRLMVSRETEPLLKASKQTIPIARLPLDGEDSTKFSG